ncbi:MAG TPA: hypothetical protein VFT21_05440 [Gemmatimonadaceae bacterium]|nr:hypothetical protein [Gemmatimonadaceae bacterium]
MQKAAALLIALGVLTTSNAGAQQKRDSVDARRKAAGAQARFELVRRTNLPLEYTGSPTKCDAHIGRFCQWNNDEDTIEAKQPRVIRKARESLIAALDSAQKKAPRDGWITGQRVRYLIEAKNDTAAYRVARECQAAEWWCAALEGLALQQSWNGIAADSAFARALRTMPAGERCRWTDMTPILDPPLRSRYKKVGCGRNDQVAERLWWLADPFWSLAGNDRRTEHYARHTMAKIQEPARNAFNLSWSNDLREMVVRYGWARYWTRGPSTGAGFDPRSGPVSGHESSPNYHFVPVSLSADTFPKVAFDLDLGASAERYSPVMSRRVFEILPQVAVFRRGDSSLVVVAYDVGTRRELDSLNMSGALVVARDEKSPMYQSTDHALRKGALSVIVDSRPQIMSLEVINVDNRLGAAWRREVLPLKPNRRGSVSMSDPLLFEPSNAEVSDVESAMRTAIGTNTVRRGKVGIYWETYGLARTDSAQTVSLTLTRVQVGTLRRIGQSIGLASKSSPLTIRWNQMMSVGSVTARSVVLDLSLIPRGKYVLRVETGPDAKRLASTSRTIEIE